MTGFTYPIVQNGIDFRTFALSCTAAFGPLFVDGKLPLDKQVLNVTKSTYRAERLVKTETELAAYLALTPKQRIAKAKKDIKASIVSTKLSLKEVQAENRKLQVVLDDVRAWRVPTASHIRFKEYMIEQLTGSLHDFTYYHQALQELKDQTPEDLIDSELAFLTRKLNESREDAIKESELNVFNQAWADGLYNSLPAPKRKGKGKRH